MRCKNPDCKDKFKPKYFLQKHCMEKDECVRLEIELKKEKALKKKIVEWKVDTHSKNYKGRFQKQINLLARKIDGVFNLKCIDCEGEYGDQIDGAHYHSRGGNCTLSYNLHNIHSAKSNCNQYSDKHKEGYKEGLKKRYGSEYQEMVLSLPLKYKQINLSSQDICDKLKIVSALNRTFETYKLESPIQAREMFNKIIGIYK